MANLTPGAQIAIAWAKAGVECGAISKESAFAAIRSDLSRDCPNFELDEPTFTVRERVNG